MSPLASNILAFIASLTIAACGAGVSPSDKSEVVGTPVSEQSLPLASMEVASTETFDEEANDPFGLKAVEKDFEKNSTLLACAENPSCEEHADALAWTAMIDLGEVSSRLGEDQKLNAIFATIFEQLPQTNPLETPSNHTIWTCLEDVEKCDDIPFSESEVASFRKERILALEEDNSWKTTRDADMEEAMARLRRSAQLGSAPALNELGLAYKDGLYRLKNNDTLAAGYFIDAVNKNDGVAAFNLALMIEHNRAGPTHNIDGLLMKALDAEPEVGYILLERAEDMGIVREDIQAFMDSYDPDRLEKDDILDLWSGGQLSEETLLLDFDILPD